MVSTFPFSRGLGPLLRMTLGLCFISSINFPLPLYFFSLFVSLNPKVDSPSHLRDFWPISLVGFLTYLSSGFEWTSRFTQKNHVSFLLFILRNHMIMLVDIFFTICFLDLGLMISGEVRFIPVYYLVILMSWLIYVWLKRLASIRGWNNVTLFSLPFSPGGQRAQW